MSEISVELRRELVKQAVAVVRQGVEKGGLQKTGRAQFSNLTGVCQEASCPEEIELYVRYQAGRKLWSEVFQEALVKGIKAAFEEAKGSYEAQGIDGWRLYSVFVAREFTYQEAVKKGRGS